MDKSKREALASYSEQLINHIRQREGEILKIFLTLVGVLTLYGFALRKSYAFNYELFNGIILIGATIIIQMIFTWVGCYILATSYNYRSLQCIFSRIQYTLGILSYKPGKWMPWHKDTRESRHEDEWTDKQRRYFDFVPELQKIQIYATIAFNIIFTISTFLISIINYTCLSFPSTVEWVHLHVFLSILPVVTFYIFFRLLHFTQKVYIRKYRQLDFIHDKDIIVNSI